MISLIRSSRTPEKIARNGLMNSFKLSEIQAKAIHDLRHKANWFRKRDKLKEEYDAFEKKKGSGKAIAEPKKHTS